MTGTTAKVWRTRLATDDAEPVDGRAVEVA
jgi:hypothetical protein